MDICWFVPDEGTFSAEITEFVKGIGPTQLGPLGWFANVILFGKARF